MRGVVFEVEVMGLALAAELVRAEAHMDVVKIGTDSQAALQATRNTMGAPGQHLLDKYQERLEVAQRRHGADTVEVRWTPGQDSLAGNEKADVEAKRAAHGDSSPACQLPKSCRGPVPVSRLAEQ